MVTATAAVLRGIDTPFTFEDVTLDALRPDEIRIAVSSAGLCHTDLAVVHGHLPSPTPIVLGHEGAGIVAEIGSAVTAFQVGDRVAASFASCGHCANCLSGKAAYCAEFYTLNIFGTREDGSITLTDDKGETLHGAFFGQSSFATQAIVNQHNAVHVPEGIDLDIVGPLGCGIQTGAGAIINTLKVPAGSSVLVSGTGAVGLSAIMAAKVAGATTIIAVDVLQPRLDMATELGATHTIMGTDADVVEHVQAITGGFGADFAVDTTAISPVVMNVINATRFGGHVGLVGVGKPDAMIPINATAGRTFYGLVEGDAIPQIFIPHMIAMNAAGAFPFEKLITKYPFAEIERAVADTQSGVAIKAVLVM